MKRCTYENVLKLKAAFEKDGGKAKTLKIGTKALADLAKALDFEGNMLHTVADLTLSHHDRPDYFGVE